MKRRKKNKRQERERPRRILDSKSRTTPGWVAGWLADSPCIAIENGKDNGLAATEARGNIFSLSMFLSQRHEMGTRGRLEEMEMVYLERKRREGGGGRGDRRIAEKGKELGKKSKIEAESLGRCEEEQDERDFSIIKSVDFVVIKNA